MLGTELTLTPPPDHPRATLPALTDMVLDVSVPHHCSVSCALGAGSASQVLGAGQVQRGEAWRERGAR